jgi:hypothetical protein
MSAVSSSSQPGPSSSASVYPLSSGSAYSAPVYSVPTGSSSSSSVNVPSYGNYSATVTYSVPSYKASSVSVYGDNAKSTLCTTSSAKGASSTPGYDVYPNSAPVYGDYPSYPISSVKKNDYYANLPSFSVYKPATTSAPVYGDYNSPPVSKTTITTTYTTTYVDVCETGYITKTTTFAITYCPTTTPISGKPTPPPTYGWETKTTVCNSGCGNGPKTVTITVPCTKCNYVSPPTPTPAKPSPPPVVPPPGKSVCNGYDCKDTIVTTKIYSTKIITLTKSPVPDTPKSMPYGGDNKGSSKSVDKSVSTPVVSKPSGPASGTPVVSKPVVPVPTPGKGNGTISMSVGTVSKTTPTKTGYGPPVFTGAAASLQGGAVVAVVGVVAAMFL